MTVTPPPARPSSRAATGRVFGLLLAAAALATLAVLPYQLSLTDLPASPPLPVLIGLSLLQVLVQVGIAAWVGLSLGPRVGLGAPLLADWLAGAPGALARIRTSLPLAVGLGLSVALAIALLEGLLFRTALPADLPRPAPWQGLLASLYGGIVEEILLRLGLMTLLVWLGTKLLRAERPAPALIWTANGLTALLFGLAHLPLAAELTTITPLLLVRTLALNGLAGLAYGWLYWRRGLLPAMAAHFTTDIVLHGVLPTFARA